MWLVNQLVLNMWLVIKLSNIKIMNHNFSCQRADYYFLTTKEKGNKELQSYLEWKQSETNC